MVRRSLENLLDIQMSVLNRQLKRQMGGWDNSLKSNLGVISKYFSNGFCCPCELEIKAIIWVCTWRRVNCKFEEERKTISQVSGPAVCAGISCRWLKFMIILSLSTMLSSGRVQLAEISIPEGLLTPVASYKWMLSLSPHLLYSSFPNTFLFLLLKSYLFIKPFSHPTSFIKSSADST